jgi:hypothetical protein
MNQDLYNFHLFQYTNTSIRRSQRLIDKSRNRYIEFFQAIKNKQDAMAQYYATIGNQLNQRLGKYINKQKSS